MANAARLLDRLVAQLTAEGDLTPDWRETFLAVPRHVFIPDTVWRHDSAIDGPHDLVPVRRGEQPDQWLEIAYANWPVTVQVDDGHPLGPDVVSVEIDETLAGHAQRALKAAGYDAVTILTVSCDSTKTGCERLCQKLA